MLAIFLVNTLHKVELKKELSNLHIHKLTLINIANGAIISGCDSTRSDSTSKDASASAAYPLPM